jgi:hypothetical protein
MGRCQTETSYLKSVLLWLQEYWTEPDPPHIYPLKEVEGGSRHSSVKRTRDTLNRQDVIVDLPAFLPPRKSLPCRRRINLNLEKKKHPNGQRRGMHGITRAGACMDFSREMKSPRSLDSKAHVRMD